MKENERRDRRVILTSFCYLRHTRCSWAWLRSDTNRKHLQHLETMEVTMPDRFKPMLTAPSIRSHQLSIVEQEQTMTPQASAYRLRQQLEIRQVEQALEHKDITGTKSIDLPW